MLIKVVGIKTTKFTAKDGTEINGMTIYYTQPMRKTQGEGDETGHFFLSQNKVAGLGFKLAVGQLVSQLFNRWGKVETLTLSEEGEDIDFGKD